MYEEHDIHADGRVKTPSYFPPWEHTIQKDKQVDEGASKLKEHGIQADDRVSSPVPVKQKDHSLSSDTKVTQRAHQLLEHFLEQDRKASAASNRSGNKGEAATPK